MIKTAPTLCGMLLWRQEWQLRLTAFWLFNSCSSLNVLLAEQKVQSGSIGTFTDYIKSSLQSNLQHR
jgi:hypothetical protein